MERKSYTMEFKKQVIKEAHDSGNIAEVARKHDLRPEILYKWKRQLKSSKTSIFEIITPVDNPIMTRIEAMLDKLTEGINQDDTSDLNVSIKGLETEFKRLNREITDQFAEVKRMLNHMNRRIGDIDLAVHSMTDTIVQPTS
jgi:transposase